MTGAAIRVVMVDDQQIVSDSIAAFLNTVPDIEVVGNALDVESGISLIFESNPDVVLLDVEMPGRGSFDIAKEIYRHSPITKIVYFTEVVSDIFVYQAVNQAKARGYLMKNGNGSGNNRPLQTLVDCIRRVSTGEYYFCAEVKRRLRFDSGKNEYSFESKNRLADLSDRQLSVMRLLAKGLSVKEVARTLKVSDKSVDSHKYRLMRKLGINDRVQLARYAIREGLVLP